MTIAQPSEGKDTIAAASRPFAGLDLSAVGLVKPGGVSDRGTDSSPAPLVDARLLSAAFARSPLPHHRGPSLDGVPITSLLNVYAAPLFAALETRSLTEWKLALAGGRGRTPADTPERSALLTALQNIPRENHSSLLYQVAREAAREVVVHLAVAEACRRVRGQVHTTARYVGAVLECAKETMGFRADPSRKTPFFTADERVLEVCDMAVSGNDARALFILANTAAERLALLGSRTRAYEALWLARGLQPLSRVITEIAGRVPPFPDAAPVRGRWRAPGELTPTMLIPDREEILLASRRIGAHLHDLRGVGVVEDSDALTPLTRHPQFVNLVYKGEHTTRTRAYKIRGAFNVMFTFMDLESAGPRFRKFSCCSTGNHALAVLHAASILRPDSVRVVVPTCTPEPKAKLLREKIESLRQIPAASGSGFINAELIVEGATFDESRIWLAAHTPPDEFAVPPYENRHTIAGQGTIGREILMQLAPVFQKNRYVEDVHIFCAIGGGGLLSGIVRAIELFKSDYPEFTGVNFHFHGFQVAPDQLAATKRGSAIAVRQVPPDIHRFLTESGVHFHVTTDTDMEVGVAALSREIHATVEGAAGATRGRYRELVEKFGTDARTSMFVFIISGGNV